MDYGTSSDPKVKVVRTKIAALIIFVSHSMAILLDFLALTPPHPPPNNVYPLYLSLAVLYFSLFLYFVFGDNYYTSFQVAPKFGLVWKKIL